MEAKDKFFFSLKSHRTQAQMEEYTRLENILFGMLFLYGILDIYECCEIIRDNMIEDMTYDELEEFILLPFKIFLCDRPLISISSFFIIGISFLVYFISSGKG